MDTCVRQNLAGSGGDLVAECRRLCARAAAERARAVQLQSEIVEACERSLALRMGKALPAAERSMQPALPPILDTFLVTSASPYRHAKAMIDNFGRHAYRRALSEALDKRQRQDVDGLAYWQSVLQAIREVQTGGRQANTVGI